GPRAVVVLLLALDVEAEVVGVGGGQVDLQRLGVVVAQGLVVDLAQQDGPADPLEGLLLLAGRLLLGGVLVGLLLGGVDLAGQGALEPRLLALLLLLLLEGFELALLLGGALAEGAPSAHAGIGAGAASLLLRLGLV